MKKQNKEKTEKPKMHIASCSFGKDSIATILLALKHGEPLDRVVFSEVMFDRERGISGEIPCHIEWIYGTAIPRLESMGVKVDVVRADKDYKSLMLGKKKNGTYYGHQYRNPCFANGELKLTPIKKYFSELRKDFDVIQYVGIATDEPVRLERLKKDNTKISLLEKYGYSQEDTMALCKQEDLLSPYYSSAYRGGVFLLS